MGKVLRRLARLQDVLGEHQDADRARPRTHAGRLCLRPPLLGVVRSCSSVATDAVGVAISRPGGASTTRSPSSGPDEPVLDSPPLSAVA
jgi:hypothetical protein